MTRSPYLALVLLMLAAPWPSLVLAQPEMSMKTLIERTLEQGSAQSWMGGGLAERFLKQVDQPTKAGNALVLVSMKKLSDLGQNCGRLEVVTSKPGGFFVAKNGQKFPAEMGIQMNICSDGSPPPAGMDIRQLAPGIAPLRPTRPPIDIK